MKKLILSLFMCFMLVISIVTSTFAFVVINSNASVEIFDFNIEGQEGLLISLDGMHYVQDIPSDDLKEYVFGSVETYNQTQFTGVTLKHENKSIVIDNETKEVQFVKDYIQNSEHVFVDAVKNKDYLAFDLWLKTEANTEEEANFDVNFTKTTGLTATPYEVTLDNSLNTMTDVLQPGSKLKVNPANAMRMGILNHKQNGLRVYECPTEEDLGSVAIEGATEAKNDPQKNAMYTYYNRIFPLTPFTHAAEAGLEGFSSSVIRNDYNEVMDTFNIEYNVMHLTVYIWLEGWDADYLMGIPANSIRVEIGFEMNRKN